MARWDGCRKRSETPENEAAINLIAKIKWSLTAGGGRPTAYDSRTGGWGEGIFRKQDLHL